MFRRLLSLLCLLPLAAFAQAPSLQDVLQTQQDAVEKASRKTVDQVLAALVDAQAPGTLEFIEAWGDKRVWMRKDDKLFFYVVTDDNQTYTLLDLATRDPAGTADKRALKQLKPNSGVRSVLASYLVQFQLSDPDPARRADALTAIERAPDESHYAPLQASVADEGDATLRARKERLVRLLAVQYAPDPATRIAAIESFAGDLGVDARSVLNPILASTPVLDAPDGANIARALKPGDDLDIDTAFDLALAADKVAPIPSVAERKAALEANITDGTVGGVRLDLLNTQEGRDRAYAALSHAGTVPDWQPGLTKAAAIADLTFTEVYAEPDPAITDAAAATLASINRAVGLNQMLDLSLDALSLASIYFLAAIGLAITFGVMGVINMAHGEFIMMGAYTGYVIQQIIPDYTVSILVAVPVAFAVTFAAGVAMERLVIRWLYNRPLETLLATFGISIALQQLAKNIFGTQARPLTSPGWLDGAWVLNDVVSISYIRIAIFVLSLIFLALLLFILNRTRLGLEVRAVTQNPRMAASMGINPDRINMLTFGLGSGIAGIAGVAIGLYAKVTSELGADYIVQSFMTVVVGGVGNIWGTLLGAGLVGSLQKGIEWFNPSNTLAAQTYMILFIILFIQIRPRGIIALKGRAAGD
ncbi:urea ABC transporter permease subunit UrtB [Actibacterium ureilyticum]|uniref:urea ABC transporter permease subunit UrtB n=1 Tax=Actibacterium ureilyticum TaxID=1590614 RepID=UPI000BAAC0AB|nr:urea ABC transporter permease subunit UrtB [Actibacterium ureilyticum]